MNQSNIIQTVSIGVVVTAIFISGYILVGKSGKAAPQRESGRELTSIVDGKQLIQMRVMAVGYSPNFFKVKAGIPVRWEITSSGQPGCASGVVVANGLTDPIYLNPQQGQVVVKEFTPQTQGTYSFTCPMGMAKGVIEVVN